LAVGKVMVKDLLNGQQETVAMADVAQHVISLQKKKSPA